MRVHQRRRRLRDDTKVWTVNGAGSKFILAMRSRFDTLVNRSLPLIKIRIISNVTRIVQSMLRRRHHLPTPSGPSHRRRPWPYAAAEQPSSSSAAAPPTGWLRLRPKTTEAAFAPFGPE